MFREYSSTFFLLCVIALLAMVSTSLINPLLSIFAKEVGATGIYIGVVVAGYWVSRILFEIPSGFISSKFGNFLPMFLGLLLTTAGTLMNAFVADPFQLIIARALQGIGAPLFFAVSMAFVVDLFSANRRGSAMGLFQGIEFAGTIVGSAFSGYIVSTLDFRASFLLAALMAGASLVMLMLIPGIRKQSRSNPAKSTITLSSMRRVFSNRNLLIVCGATFAEFVMTTGVLTTVLPLYAKEDLGISLTEIGFIIGARSVGFVVAMLIMGTISDRIGRRPVLAFGTAATAALMAVMSLATSFTALSILLFAIGVTSGAIWIVSPVVVAEAVEPHHRGAAIGTYRTFFDLGSIVGPIIMSGVQQSSGAAACFYLSAALLFANFVPATRIRESKPQLIA